MNNIIKNNVRKLKSWSKMVDGEVVITKPKDEFQFQVTITIINNAIKSGQLSEEKLMGYLKKER